ADGKKGQMQMRGETHNPLAGIVVEPDAVDPRPDIPIIDIRVIHGEGELETARENQIKKKKRQAAINEERPAERLPGLTGAAGYSIEPVRVSPPGQVEDSETAD